MNLHAVIILAQATSVTGWEQIFAVYGPFAPFALSCVVVIKVLWDRLKEQQNENKELQAILIDKVVPLLTTSNSVLTDATKFMEKQTEITHSVIEVGDQLSEVMPLLRRLQPATQRRAPRKKA